MSDDDEKPDLSIEIDDLDSEKSWDALKANREKAKEPPLAEQDLTIRQDIRVLSDEAKAAEEEQVTPEVSQDVPEGVPEAPAQPEPTQEPEPVVSAPESDPLPEASPESAPPPPPELVEAPVVPEPEETLASEEQGIRDIRQPAPDLDEEDEPEPEPVQDTKPALKQQKLEDDTPKPQKKMKAKKPKSKARAKAAQGDFAVRLKENIEPLNTAYLAFVASSAFVMPIFHGQYVYLVLMLGLFAYGLFFCGRSFLEKPTAWQKSHYSYLVATSWMGALYFFVAFVAAGISGAIGAAALIFCLYWWIMRLMKGVKLLNQRQSIENPETWWL